MPVKIARSTPRPSFGLPELLVASHISRLASRDAAKSLLSALVSESSGECRVKPMLVVAAAVPLRRVFVMTKLSRAVIACISATMMLLGVAPIARADTVPLIDDPLHGHCLAGCTSNGTNTPIGSNPPQGFYFQASPASSGAYFIDVLVPNNMLIAGPLHITGDLTFVLNLFSATAWTSGELGNYLGFTNPSPSTPIGAYLPATQALEPGATGFFVFLSSFGRDVSLPQQGSLTTGPLLNLTGRYCRPALTSWPSWSPS